MSEVFARDRHLVEPAAEELDMLGLFPQERREEDLLFDPTLAGYDHDQRQQVGGDALLARLEQRHGTEQKVAFDGVERGPVRTVG